MADIGVPQFVSGQNAVEDDGSTGKAIAAGIKAVGDMVSDGIVSEKTNALEDALQANASAAVEADMTDLLQPDQERLGHVFTSTAEQELYDNLNRMRRLSAQTSGAAKLALLNRAKALTANAMAANPSLRDALVQEYRDFIAFNPNLDTLDALGAQRDADAAEAQKQLDAIWKTAYGRVQDGGLGINADTLFGTPKFIKQYTDRISARSEEQAGALFMESLETKDSLNLAKSADQLNQTLQGKRNQIDAYFREDNDYLAGVREAQLRQIQGKGTANDASLLAAFSSQNGRQQEIIGKYDVFVNELNGMKGKISITERETAMGQRALEQIDNAIDYIERWKEAVTNLTESPTLTELMEMETSVRQAQWNRDNPIERNFLDDVRRYDKVFEHAEALGLEDVQLQDDIGSRIAIPLLRERMVNTYVFGQYALNGSPNSPDAVRAQIQRAVTLANDPYEAATPVERGEKALSFLAGNFGDIGNTYDIYKVAGDPSRAPIDHMLGSATAHVMELRNGQQYAPATIDAIGATISQNPKVFHTIEASRVEGTTPNTANAAGALGAELTEYITDMPNGGMNGYLAQIRAAFAKLEGNVPLGAYVIPSFDSIGNGKVVFRVASDAGKRIAEERAAQRPGSRFTGVGTTQADAKREQRRIEAAVARLERRTNNALNLVTMADYLKDTQAQKPAFGLAWDDYGFGEIFPQVGAE